MGTRIRAREESGNVIWPATMFFGTWILVVLLLLIGWGIKDVMAVGADTCNVSRVTFEKQQAQTGHKLISAIKENWRDRFIIEWNKSPPTAEGATDVAIYEIGAGLPITRLVFFNHDCFVDYFDIPTKSLMDFIQKVGKESPSL